MEREIVITVKNKVAAGEADAFIVCNNSDYTATFVFDDEWDNIPTKTARFTAGGKYTDRVFTGNSVPIPPISNAAYVLIGVYAGEMTTSPAYIPCQKSILCDGGKPNTPTEDVYAQIIEMLNDMILNGVTDEQLAYALDKYLEENPIDEVKVETDDTLKYVDGKLGVNTTNEVAEDNTLPITSAAIHKEIGNINVLLGTI